MTIHPSPVERAVAFPSRGQPSFVLEGTVHAPADLKRKGQGCAPVVILCHPQPASSDMHDLLTTMLAQRLAESGMIALRFNFRGVGKSQGQQSDGRMEPLDLAGAIDCALAQPGANAGKVCGRFL